LNRHYFEHGTGSVLLGLAAVAAGMLIGLARGRAQFHQFLFGIRVFVVPALIVGALIEYALSLIWDPAPPGNGVSCKDRVGIVARVATFIASLNGWIVEANHHADESSGSFLYDKCDSSGLFAI
jgi:hypothetical protein